MHEEKQMSPNSSAEVKDGSNPEKHFSNLHTHDHLINFHVTENVGDTGLTGISGTTAEETFVNNVDITVEGTQTITLGVDGQRKTNIVLDLNFERRETSPEFVANEVSKPAILASKLPVNGESPTLGFEPRPSSAVKRRLTPLRKLPAKGVGVMFIDPGKVSRFPIPLWFCCPLKSFYRKSCKYLRTVFSCPFLVFSFERVWFLIPRYIVTQLAIYFSFPLINQRVLGPGKEDNFYKKLQWTKALGKVSNHLCIKITNTYIMK